MIDLVTGRLVAAAVALGLAWAGLGAPTVESAAGIGRFAAFAVGRLAGVAVVLLAARYLYVRLRGRGAPRSGREG